MLTLAYTALAAATGVWAVLLVAAVIGIGRGIAAAGSSPFTAQLTDERRRREAFGRQYQAMNIGLGLGALLASALLVGLSSRTLPMMFVLNGLSFLPIAVFMLRHATPRYQRADPGEPVERPSLRRLLASAGPIALLQFAISAFGFSQFESTMPLVAHHLSGASLGFVSLVVAANTVAVIALQSPVMRWLKPRRPELGVRVVAAFWIGGYLTTAAASLLPGVTPLGGLLLLGVVFAAGEAAFSCSYQPMLLASVPVSAATRASSLSNAASGAGTALGPALGVLLLGTGSAALVWGSLGISCTGLLLLIRFAERPRRTA